MKNKRVLSKTIALKTAVETEGLQLLWQIKFPKILGRSFCKKHFRYKTKKQRQNTAEGAQHKRQRKGKTILHVQLQGAWFFLFVFESFFNFPTTGSFFFRIVWQCVQLMLAHCVAKTKTQLLRTRGGIFSIGE